MVTVGDMEEIKRKLLKSAMKTDEKRSIWAVLVLLFMGSLRGSELLSYDKLKFDPVKTLLGGDISLIKAMVGKWKSSLSGLNSQRLPGLTLIRWLRWLRLEDFYAQSGPGRHGKGQEDSSPRGQACLHLERQQVNHHVGDKLAVGTAPENHRYVENIIEQ